MKKNLFLLWTLTYSVDLYIRMSFSQYIQRGPKKCQGQKKFIHSVPLPFSFTVLPFDKVALAFMWLAPSFERISHYTPYIIFRLCPYLTSIKLSMHVFGPISTKIVKEWVNFINVRSNTSIILINSIISLFDDYFLVPYFAYFYSLKMEAIYSSEMLGLFRTTWRYTNTEERQIYIHDLSGIRTQIPSVRTVGYSARLYSAVAVKTALEISSI
jgi:hypothetical protein